MKKELFHFKFSLGILILLKAK